MSVVSCLSLPASSSSSSSSTSLSIRDKRGPLACFCTLFLVAYIVRAVLRWQPPPYARAKSASLDERGDQPGLEVHHSFAGLGESL